MGSRRKNGRSELCLNSFTRKGNKDLSILCLIRYNSFQNQINKAREDVTTFSGQFLLKAWAAAIAVRMFNQGISPGSVQSAPSTKG